MVMKCIMNMPRDPSKLICADKKIKNSYTFGRHTHNLAMDSYCDNFACEISKLNWFIHA